MVERDATERSDKGVGGRGYRGVALAGVALALGGCSPVGGESDDGPASTPSVVEAADVSAALLGRPCNQAPVEELPPGVGLVDVRCDMYPGASTGIYAQSSREGEVLDELYHGDVVRYVCATLGQKVRNQIGGSSDQWLYVTGGERGNPEELGRSEWEITPGYVAAINVRTNSDELPAC